MATTIPAGRHSDRCLARVVVAAAALPLLVLIVRVVRSQWLSSADWASIELRTRDVGTRHTPLVGVYSRYGWNHPGPLLFYVLALPYRLLGAQGHGILAGALLVNAAALACIAIVLWRRGQIVGLALGLGVALLLLRALGPGFLVDPWNPYVIVVPLFAVVCLAWAAADGDLWALPVAIGVGSFVVQSHVGAAVAVLAAIGVALVVVLIDARRYGRARRLRISRAGFAVAVVAWSPPIVQQFQPGGGNLGDLARFWTRAHANMTGWSAGARIVLQQLSIPAPWLTGHEKVKAFTAGVDPGWHVPFALVLLIGCAAAAARRRDRQSLVLDALALAMVLAAVYSAAHIVEAPYAYIVRWMWVVGATVWLAIIWTSWRALPRDKAGDLTSTRTLTAVIASFAVWLAVVAVHADFPVQSDQGSLAAIAPAARRALAELPGPVLLEASADFHSALTSVGLLLIAIHAGIDARLTRAAANAVGTAHTISETSAGSLVVVALDQTIDKYRTDPAYRSVARYDPLSVEERAYHAAVDTKMRHALSGGIAAFDRWSDSHKADQERIRAFDRRGPRIELFLRLRTAKNP